MSHPNWDLVPFDVSCARCGHNLRGLTEPNCPACNLEFDWSVAVPIEQLTCLECDYQLLGLTGTRCPECGQDFEWQQILDRYRRRQKMLFEYRWRDNPMRSLIRSWFSALRPKRFWSRLDIHDPPQIKPLISMVAFSLIGFVFTTATGVGVFAWLSSTWRKALGYADKERS